jgi:hypothetical protein
MAAAAVPWIDDPGLMRPAASGAGVHCIGTARISLRPLRTAPARERVSAGRRLFREPAPPTNSAVPFHHLVGTLEPLAIVHAIDTENANLSRPPVRCQTRPSGAGPSSAAGWNVP